MSRTIWKYGPLSGGYTELTLPEGAKVLSAQVQGGEINLWAEVDSSMPSRKRFFYVYGTGHELPDNPGTFIGTVQLHGGALVFHVYEGLT
jgi:hypothetical protein